jgi:thiol-disulfide isomerase/thioredoxin
MNHPTKIPIKNGSFNYTFSIKSVEAFELIFEDEFENGSWSPVLFFPTNGIVEFTLNPQNQWNNNTVIGGALNKTYATYQTANKIAFEKPRAVLMNIQKELVNADEFESDEFKAVLKSLRAIQSSDHDAKVPIYNKMEELEKTYARYSQKGKTLFAQPYDSLMNVELKWKYDYIKQNISIVGYYLIWKDVEMQMKNKQLVAQLVSDVFPLYQQKFPNHIYTKLIKTQLAGQQSIIVGGKYIDFKAPSIQGDSVQLSTVIQNHVALIDFWGSWCGPCIAKSRLVVPIYEQYKDKGFTIVGIAREFVNTDDVKNRLSKEQFAWLNLVDLDDKLTIWNKYGISNGTGLMVLVDKDGTILAIDPKPEELKKILNGLFN